MVAAKHVARVTALLFGLAVVSMLAYNYNPSFPDVMSSATDAGRRLANSTGSLSSAATDAAYSANTLWSLFCNAIVTAIFACLYKAKVINNLSDIDGKHLEGKREDRQFEHSLFDCLGDRHVCCYHLCCLPVVVAKNMAVTGVMEFWPGCILAWITYNLCQGTCIGPIIRTCLFEKVKRKIGVEESFLRDCCCQFWCPSCVAAQESMEIDMLLGVEVDCIGIEELENGSESNEGIGIEELENGSESNEG